MSDILKCPYCGGILEQTSIYNINAYACTDLTCKGYYMTATKDMWQELIRTKKQLEIYQEFITKLYLNSNITDEQLERIKRKQIKALEQKDVK